jgi:hypothetical protein
MSYLYVVFYKNGFTVKDPETLLSYEEHSDLYKQLKQSKIKS